MDGKLLIDTLELQAHPEGGWFRETWMGPSEDGGRPVGSAIYYLLLEGERSRRHRVDVTEIWHFYAGESLELHVLDSEGNKVTHLLGADVESGDVPQVIVPPMAWQWANPLGSFTLVGCTVIPAFQWEGFEMWEE